MSLRRTQLLILGFLAVALLGLLAAACWKNSHGWREVRSMITPRRDHQAICLKDGRVLVFGGFTVDLKPVLSCELFDPVHETWSRAGALPYGYGVRGVMLADGRVLVTDQRSEKNPRTGNGVFSDPAWQIFDPGTNAWSSVLNPQLTGVSVEALLVLNDGRVLVYSYPYSQQGLLYHPTTNSWSNYQNCPRDLIDLIRLKDGQVLGMQFSSEGFNRLFDPHMETWSPCAQMRAIVGWGTALPDGTAFFLSESFASPKVHLYDPKTNSWTKYGSPRKMDENADVRRISTEHFDLTQLKSGNVLMTGGFHKTWDYHGWNLSQRTSTNEAVAECDLFDWKSKEWKKAGELPQPRMFHTTTLLNDGRVLVTGGVGSDLRLINSCEIGFITENP